MTAFGELPELTVGDDFFLDVAGETLAYRISSTLVVLPTDLTPLARDPHKDQATLITCTPYGINSHRLLVTGQRIPLEKALQTQRQDGFVPRIQPWMRPRWALATLAPLLLAGLVVSWLRQDRRRARRHRASAGTIQPGSA